MPITVPDQNIALQTKAPDGMSSLSSMLNMAQNVQQYKADKANLGEKTAIRSLAQDPSVQNPDGSLNSDKFTAQAQVVAPTLGAGVAQGNLANQSQQTANAGSNFALHKEYADAVYQTATGLAADPRITGANGQYDPMAANQALSEGFQQAIAKGVPTDRALFAIAPLVNAVRTPGAVSQMLQNTIAGQMAPGQQAAALSPSGVGVSNGQQTSVVNTNPLAPGIAVGQAIPGTTQQQQLPPTTPTMVNGTPGYLGPQGQPQAQQSDPQGGFDPSKLSESQLTMLASKYPKEFAAGIQSFSKRGQPQAQSPQQQQPFVASGLPVGASAGIAGTQDNINTDWGATQKAASTANQNIGILQNIKQHAAGAATGVGASRLALSQGVLGMIGISPADAAKTDFDLLEKNSNMLALAGGNTDAARGLAQAANPNSHMTEAAIRSAADQVIGQQKLALAKANYLTPYKAQADQGNAGAYNTALNTFNSVADPKVIQFSDMSDKDASAMLKSMSVSDKAAFRSKLDKAIQLGIAK